MDNNSLKKIERLLFIVFLTLGFVAIIGIVLLIRFGKNENRLDQESPTKDQAGEEEYDWEAGLSDNTLWLPENCKIYSKVPDFTFTDEQGKLYQISDFEGKPTVIVFWASWCSDCQQQMPLMNQYIESTKAYGDIRFIFVNKTDGEKETKDSAKEYFEKLGIESSFYYDESLSAYEKLGIHNIPTTLFLDAKGVITAWSPKQITQTSNFNGILEKAIYGGDFATLEFVSSRLMDSEGGIHCEYGKSDSETYSSDILSESEGAMLEYAVLSKNQMLFERIVNYIETNLLKDGLAAWKLSDGKASKVNALIDDLRIYKAIEEAQELWGGYEEILKNYQEQLLTYGMQKRKYVDFYDSNSKTYATRFTLCYGDLATMSLLAKDSQDFEMAYKACESLVLKGQISEAFPLYYSWYNYDKNRYEKDELNAAEAMMTLLHLAEVDLLPDNSIHWLKKQMEGSGIKARYTVNGSVVKGYNYDSTAVYALVAMIGLEEDEPSLVDAAVRKMEKMRIYDTSLDYNGAFGMEDGSGITSFDQVIPLLTYAKLNNKQERTK